MQIIVWILKLINQISLKTLMLVHGSQFLASHPLLLPMFWLKLVCGDTFWSIVFLHRYSSFDLHSIYNCFLTVLLFFSQSQGNWIHLKFASRLQARKALARNGRLLTDTLIIGVVPCTDGVIHKIKIVNKDHVHFKLFAFSHSLLWRKIERKMWLASALQPWELLRRLSQFSGIVAVRLLWGPVQLRLLWIVAIWDHWLSLIKEPKLIMRYDL